MAKVQIYTTPTCAFCRMAKDYFKEKGIEYEEFNVAEDAEKRQELFDKTGAMSVPVIIIGDKNIIGFDKGQIDEALSVAQTKV